MATTVVFQGVKFYWRTRNTLDVMLVEHDSLYTTEVVTYDPSLDREAPRIYLDSNLLYAKLNHEDLGLGDDNALNKAKFDYVIDRLVISEYTADMKTIRVSFQPIGSGKHENEDICCPRPISLVPYRSLHYHTLMEEVVEDVMKVLKEEHEEAMGCAPVTKENVDTTLSYRERWRIPVVMIKTGKNRRLSDPDIRIWQKVTSNMTTEADAACMAAVFTSPVSGAASTTEAGAEMQDIGTSTTGSSVAPATTYVSVALSTVTSKPASKKPKPSHHSPKPSTLQRTASRQHNDAHSAAAPSPYTTSHHKASSPVHHNQQPPGRVSKKVAPNSPKPGSRAAAGKSSTIAVSSNDPMDEHGTVSDVQAESNAFSSLLANVQAVAIESLRFSFGISFKRTVWPVDNDADGMSVCTHSVSLQSAELAAEILPITEDSAVASTDLQSNGTANPSAPPVTPVADSAVAEEAAEADEIPAELIAMVRGKRSSFLTSMLSGLSFSAPSGGGIRASFGFGSGYNNAAPVSLPANPRQSRFPLVQMVLDSLAGTASSKSACSMSDN